jgi:hypothetical protein
MDSFRIDLPHPASTERAARITESESIQDEERQRKDAERKGRKRERTDEDRTGADKEPTEENVGKVLDVEA